MANSGGGIVNYAGASYLCPQSRFYHDARAKQAVRLAAEFLVRRQTPDGNIDLETTNFNSPPDTGFVVWNVAEIACAARRLNDAEIESLLKPFLLAAAKGLVKGGVHTPNHRWVVSSALSQIHSLWPDPSYLRRIDQWLAEGIDIDEDGQYTERSTTIYNTVCDRAFTLMAAKLNRPALLDPVRTNLNAMLYLLHPGYEVVTEISRRQDLNQRGDMGRYWYPLATLAIKDQNGQFATLAKHFESGHAALGTILDQPDLLAPLPKPQPVPDNYVRTYKSLPIVRIRRGQTSASILLNNVSRFFAVRRAAAVVEAVRFASAFFGKGQFRAQRWERAGDGYLLTQELDGPYYQPLAPAEHVGPEDWGAARIKRAASEVCKLKQSVAINETDNGFRIRIQSAGTPHVPVSIEIGLREGGQLTGCEPVGPAAHILAGARATYRLGRDTITFGPGAAPHRYVEVRGAEPKLTCTSVYITGLTPFEHTIQFDLS